MQINSRTNIEGNKLNVYNFTFLILHLNRIIQVRKTNEWFPLLFYCLINIETDGLYIKTYCNAQM